MAFLPGLFGNGGFLAKAAQAPANAWGQLGSAIQGQPQPQAPNGEQWLAPPQAPIHIPSPTAQTQGPYYQANAPAANALGSALTSAGLTSTPLADTAGAAGVGMAAAGPIGAIAQAAAQSTAQAKSTGQSAGAAAGQAMTAAQQASESGNAQQINSAFLRALMGGR